MVAAEATEGMYPLPEVVCLTVVLFKQLQKTSTGEKADTGFAKLKVRTHMPPHPHIGTHTRARMHTAGSLLSWTQSSCRAVAHTYTHV